MLREEHLRLLARRARLDAELANASEITLPDQLAGEASAQSLISVEHAVLEAHARQLTSQTSALQDRAALLNREVEAFGEKRQSVERQLSLAQEQLKKVQDLADDGLSVVSRVSSLETNVADPAGPASRYRHRRFAGQAGYRRCRSRTRRRSADVRVSDLTLERQDVDGQIAELELKLSTQQGLIREAVAYSGIQVSNGQQVQVYTYTIIRQGQEIPADATTPVEAGDVITARLQLAE